MLYFSFQIHPLSAPSIRGTAGYPDIAFGDNNPCLRSERDLGTMGGLKFKLNIFRIFYLFHYLFWNKSIRVNYIIANNEFF